MQTTSDEIELDDMNLWLIDDRLAYHHFLASDKLLKNAKQRNRALFDKLFEPKSKDLKHPELIGSDSSNKG